MPKIVPIKALKNTSEISELCRNSEEPIFITKNGYGDMVIMSMETYEKHTILYDVFAKLEVAERDVTYGRTKNARKSLAKLREDHGL